MATEFGRTGTTVEDLPKSTIAVDDRRLSNRRARTPSSLRIGERELQLPTVRWFRNMPIDDRTVNGSTKKHVDVLGFDRRVWNV
jgi:hypothetical protein